MLIVSYLFLVAYSRYTDITIVLSVVVYLIHWSMNQRTFMSNPESTSPFFDVHDDDGIDAYIQMIQKRKGREVTNPPKEKEKEKAYEKVEWTANPPLENTTLVYSVPVRGEWNNGHVQRLLQAMFAQRVAPEQALEINLVTNLGSLAQEIADEYEPALKKQRETQQVVAFIKAIVGE